MRFNSLNFRLRFCGVVLVVAALAQPAFSQEIHRVRTLKAPGRVVATDDVVDCNGHDYNASTLPSGQQPRLGVRVIILNSSASECVVRPAAGGSVTLQRNQQVVLDNSAGFGLVHYRNQ